jgi:hypothetical protein
MKDNAGLPFDLELGYHLAIIEYFYALPITFEHSLTLQPVGLGCRLIAVPQFMHSAYTEAEQRQLLQASQREMIHFTRYLKSVYLEDAGKPALQNVS